MEQATIPAEPGLTNEQVERRRGFIGGTDAPRLLGISPWGGPLDVWQEKMGLVKRPPPGPAARWGHLLEDAVAAEAARQGRYRVRRLKHAVIHPKYPFIGGYLDRRIIGEPGLLEVKTGSAYLSDEWGPDGSDEIPDDYFAQVQHYMACTGLVFADVAALIGGQDFRRFRIGRNDAFIDQLIAVEVAFWNDHVLTSTPPPIDGSEGSKAYLARRYPSEVGTIRPATPEEDILIRALVQARAGVKAAEAEQLLAENMVKQAIAMDAGLAGAAGVVTWKAQTAERPDWKAIAHEWKNLLALYVPSEAWAEVTITGNEIVQRYTKTQATRVLRVKEGS